MKVAISAESTIDLPKEILKEYNIRTTPFTVILGDKEYEDGEISTDQIFAYTAETKKLPKTSAVNEEQFEKYFAELRKEFDAVVHISLSSEISSTYKNAKTTAEKFENVFVVNSLSLSTGIALLAIYASNLAKDGKSGKEIFDSVTARVPHVQASFVLERLDYLYKGGRCSALSYFGANLMHIRPQILVKDGSMGAYHKYRGKMDKVVETYCKDTLDEFNTPDLSVAFVTYTTATPEMIENAVNALSARGFKKIYKTRAGGTISSHCGEHTLGILYINDGKNE